MTELRGDQLSIQDIVNDPLMASNFASFAQGALADTALQNITTEVISGLSDVTLTSPATNEVLTFNGSAWINQSISAGNNWIHANNGSNFIPGPVATGARSIAIGESCTASSTEAVVIGQNSSAARGSIVIGVDSYMLGGLGYGIAIGVLAKTTGQSGISLGSRVYAGGQDSTAIGFNTTTTLQGQVTLGNEIRAGAITGSEFAYSVKLGHGANTGNKNLLHLFDAGKLELYGLKSQFLIPTYPTASPPANPVQGSLIYDTTSAALSTYDGAAWNIVGSLQNIVEDITPQLGGHLDLNGRRIITADAVTGNAADIILLAGDAQDVAGTGTGGVVFIASGSGTLNANTAGPITIQVGVSGAGNAAPSLTLQGGTGTSAAGGSVDIIGGKGGFTTVPAGAVNITGGDPQTSAGDGGSVVISGGRGDGVSTTTGGSVVISPGGDTGISGAIAMHNAINQIGQASFQLWDDTDIGHTTGTYLEIKAPSALTTWTMTLPPTTGLNGQVLTTDGTGIATWETAGAGGVTNPLTANLDVSSYSIITENAVTSGAIANNINIVSGAASGAFGAGNINITGGSGLAGTTQLGGTVNIIGGNGDGGNGGDVTITGGYGAAGGYGGNVIISGGADSNGNGTVEIKNGSNQANIKFNSGSWIDVTATEFNVTGTVRSHLIINAQIGTTYTLNINDDGKLVTMNNAAGNFLTIPPNTTATFPIGTQILVSQEGGGQTTMVAGAGVTIHSAGSLLNLASQYTTITLIKKATDTWLIVGDLV